VVLAAPTAGSLAAKRLFYSLDAQREAVLSTPRDLDDGLWMTQGYVAERTVVTPDPGGRGGTTGFYQFGGAGGPDKIDSRDGYDYSDFPISVDATDVPRDWGGMSGGGVWQVRLKREGDTIVNQRPLLSGIMYYQTMVSAKAVSIKAHARRSVYEAAYAAIVQR
jgi:hypothetical protein